LEEYYFEQRLVGVFGVLSDLDVEARVVFEQYEACEEVEQVFDFMKNVLRLIGRVWVVMMLLGVILLWCFWLCVCILRF
jgi:hypothetical protein